jgi:hypothetical protein
MLTQLITIKQRLVIDEFNVQFDALLTNALNAVSTRFDKETNRALARTVSLTYEFDATDLEISPPCFPIEAVTKFETKSSESEGWIEQTDVEYLIRRSCIISLQAPLNLQLSTFNLQPSLGRITYTGGYVLPGATASAGQTAFPSDLEQAAVEQVAYWFQTREALGLTRVWPHSGTYEQFAQLDLLPMVSVVLNTYKRWRL